MIFYSRYEKNAEKVRRVMREKGIDVCMLTFQQKISYVTGVYHNDWNAGNCVFLWADGEPTLLVSVSEKGRLMYEGYVKDVRYWNPAFYGLEPSTFISEAIKILHEHGMENKVIGIEEPQISYRVYSALLNEFDRAEFADVEDMISDIMMVKDEEELEAMRHVCTMSDAGMQAIMDNARVGITEAELVGHAELAMRKLGAGWWYTPNQMNFDNRVICDHIPQDRPLGIGDKITFDLHPTYKEYRSDHFRTVAFGEPDKEYRKMAEFLTGVAYELNDKLVAGASTSEIAVWFRERIRNGGYPDRAMKDIGHGIGTGHLPPFFTLDKEYILRPDTIISICPYIYDPGHYSMLMEYCVRVRESGAPELLHKHPLGLPILPVK